MKGLHTRTILSILALDGLPFHNHTLRCKAYCIALQRWLFFMNNCIMHFQVPHLGRCGAHFTKIPELSVIPKSLSLRLASHTLLWIGQLLRFTHIFLRVITLIVSDPCSIFSNITSASNPYSYCYLAPSVV